MNLFTRVVGYAATTMVLCAVLFSFAGMWFGEDGSGQRLARRLVLEKRRSEALRYQREALSHSWEAKARIIRALIDGRLRLREAIDQFQRLNKELNEALASEDVDQGMVAARVPFLTDSDSIGQTILMWVRVEVAAWPPDKAKRLLADLESAFQELLRSNVKVE